MTKSVVLSHGDLDGITSGAIALLQFPGSTFYFTRPSQVHQDLFRIAKDKPDIVHISENDFQKFLRILADYLKEF